MKINYQLILHTIIDNIKNNQNTPTLLLHSCCAPCSTHVLELLSKYFLITIYYYNSNIDTKEEFDKRASEQIRLINELPTENPIKFIIENYNSEEFNHISTGLEHTQEGGSRCLKCYYLRMRTTAEYALKNNFDYFTTTLSISPHKDSQKINEIGKQIEKETNTKYLYADFKKENGYKRSLELSKKYKLYRQTYCGCKYSKRIEE